VSAGSVADQLPWAGRLKKAATQWPRVSSAGTTPRDPAARHRLGPGKPAVAAGAVGLDRPGVADLERLGTPERQRAGVVGLKPLPADAGHATAPTDITGLCDQFADVCASAVDPLEIASALEFQGLGDQAVKLKYGFDDVFTLAQHMYDQVPRRPAEPTEPPDPWQASKLQPALHSLLYALPGVCFPAAVGLLVGHGVKTTLVVALLAAWSMGQGLASLGYLRLGRSADTDQARRLLRVGLVTGLALLAAALAVTAAVVRPSDSALAFGGGEGIYMLGAGVVTVLGAERWLLVALAPAVLYSTAFLALGRPPALAHVAWAMLAATPLLALAIAGIITHPKGPPSASLFQAPEWRSALVAAGFGLVAAGLLSFPVVAGASGRGGVATGALLAALPLSLSMGVAEWSLLWYRRRTRRLLRTTDAIGAFRARARLALLAALLSYVAAAAALTVATIAVASATGLVHLRSAYVPQLAAYLTLGAAMFLALAALAFGVRALPLIICAAGLAAEIVLHDLGQTVQIATSAGLLLALGGYTAVVLSRAVRHAHY
jgi:hypothetical protein